MKAQLILDMIRTHFTGSDTDFRDAVERLARDEDLKGNMALAAEIRRAAKGIPQRHIDDEGRVHLQFASQPAEDAPDIVEIMHPASSLDDIILEPSVRDKLDQVIAEWEHPERLPVGIPPTSRMLLTGPPGCGKTMTAVALASSIGKDLAYLRLDGLVSRYMGQTGANIRRAFESVSRSGAMLFILTWTVRFPGSRHFMLFFMIQTDRGLIPSSRHPGSMP